MLLSDIYINHLLGYNVQNYVLCLTIQVYIAL